MKRLLHMMVNRLTARRQFRIGYRHWLALLVAVIVTLALGLRPWLARANEADDTVGQLWQNVYQIGAYEFRASVIQDIVPVTSVANVGRSSERQELYIEGATDLRKQTLDMTLWSQGGSIFDPNSGIELKLEDDRLRARKGDSDWEEINNFTDGVMPQGDFTVFLAGAADVQLADDGAPGEERGDSEAPTRYTYRIDGPTFASHLRERIGAQMMRRGELALHAQLDLPQTFSEMTGTGELWVRHDPAGRVLPVRQVLDLRFPDQDGYWVAAKLDVTFRFAEQTATVATTLTAALNQALTDPGHPLWHNALLTFFLVMGSGLTVFLIVRRRAVWLYKTLAALCVVSLVGAPLLQSAQASAANTRFTTRRAHQEELLAEAQAMQEASQSASSRSTIPPNPAALEMIRTDIGKDSDGDGGSDVQEALVGSNPMAADEDAFWRTLVSQQQVDPNLDSDGDGLTDQEERLLGTLPDAADSDGDSISDKAELQGFTLAGKQWYGNPLEADSNNDGVSDTQEWNNPDLLHATWDTDNDGVPDLSDRDNDGDKVPDAYDISPFSAYSEIYSANNPLQLSLKGLTADKTVFVDYQVRPTNANHLWYALSVLDWPNDNEGALKDIDKSTQDVTLTPMLEIMLSKPPYHLPLTTPNVSVPIRGVQEPGGGITPTIPLPSVSGALTLAQVGANLEIRGTLSRAAFLSIHRGTCTAVGGIVGSAVTAVRTGDGSITPITIGGQRLAELARGGYSLWITEQADNGILLGCGEIPSTPFVGDQMVDRRALEPYQVSVRDVSEDGLVKALYVPLQLVVDKEGGERVAFGGQIPFLVQSGGGALNQQVRLVWSVQMKNDEVCVSSRLKPTQEGPAYECAEEQNNVPQVVYSYGDSWQLTGLDLREDQQVELAQIYEDPAVDDQLNSDTALSALVSDLSASFLAARTNAANARDITIPEIARRFERTTNSAVSEEARWGIPNTMRVVTSTYPTLDRMMVGSIDGAKAILNEQFTSHWSASQPITPTLLNAYEWRYRVFNLDGVGKDTNSAYDTTTRQITVDWTASPVISKGYLKWLPYAYKSGDWNDLSIADYWDELARRVRPEFADEADPQVAGGKVAAVQLYYLSLFSGIGRTLQIGGAVLGEVDAKRDTELLFGKTATGGVAAFGKFILDKHITGVLIGNYIWGNTKYALFKSLYQMIEGIFDLTERSSAYFARQSLTLGFLKAGLKGGAILVGILAALVVVVGSVLFAVDKFVFNGSGTSFLKPAVSVVLLVVSLLGFKSAVTDTITVLKSVAAVIKGGSGVLKGAKLDAFMNASTNIKGAKLTAAIGLIIEVGLLWGYVIYSVFFGEVAAGNLDLGLLLAFAFAATLVAILYAAIGFIPVIGQIIVAILGLIDAIFSAACAIEDAVVAKNPGLTNSPRKIPRTEGGQCFGVSTWLTENLVPVFYQKDTIFDFSSRLVAANQRFPQLSKFNLAFANAAAGPVVGNQIRYQAQLGGTLAPSVPKNVAPSAFETSNIVTTRYFAELSSTARTDITKTVQSTQALSLPLVEYRLVDPPMKFNQISLFSGYLIYYLDRYIVTLDEQLLESAPIALTHAGVNVPFDVYFNLGLKLPVYSCTFSFCKVGQEFSESGNSTRLSGLSLDIFPANLGDFYARNWGTWSEAGKTHGVAFPTATDFDGDGLLSKPANGLDPNDLQWDSDGDGLSDAFELAPKDAQTDRPLKYTFNPTAKDADNDGLCDQQELLLRTNPSKADSDGDGLRDGEEVYHLDCNTNTWTGGWSFTYNVTQTLTMRVNSNPLSIDGDNDGMSDRVEKELHLADPAAYPFHPGVFNVSPLAFYAVSSDFDTYVATGASLVYTATLRNHFTTGDRRAEGSIMRTGGGSLGNLNQTGTYALFPTQETNFVNSLTVSGGSQSTAINNQIAAEFLTLEQQTTGTPSYQIEVPFPLTIDADNPTSSLTTGSYVKAGGVRIIGGTAQDATSPIQRVDVRIDGQTDWTLAEGAGGWAYSWDVPTSDGPRTLQTRATDVVGHVEEPVNSVQVIVDGTAPQATTTQTGNPIVAAKRNATGQWVITLTGSAADPNSGGALGSGVASVEVNVEPRSSGWLSATLNVSGQWQIAYPLSNNNADHTYAADATGQYNISVRAADKVNNQNAANAYLTYPLRVDTTAPSAKLASLVEETTNGASVELSQTLFITRNIVLTGTVTDPGDFASGVQGVEIAFVTAELLDSLDSPSLLLYLNEAEGVSSYVNAAPNGVAAQCNGNRCPLNGTEGIYGGAAQFDGSNDVISATVDLPENNLAISLWFNTSNANGGLFAATAGALGSAGADRTLYLVNGNLCAHVQGVQTDEICTAGKSYNDGQWHQAVLVLDANAPFRLYVDGALGAAAGLVTSSTLTAQNGITVGMVRDRNGADRFLDGRIDEVEVYKAALSASAVAALYRRWQAVTLATPGATSTTWSYQLPDGLEGLYQIDLRAADSRGNRNDEQRGLWKQWRGLIDTTAPRVSVNTFYSGADATAQTTYQVTVEDYTLTDSGYVGPCALQATDYHYDESSFWAQVSNGLKRLNRINSRCTVNGFPVHGEAVNSASVIVCDNTGRCTEAKENRDVLYWSTTQNDTGSSALRRANLNGGYQREDLLDGLPRITGLAVDNSRGHLYWLERDTATTGRVRRADLDGQNVTTIPLNPPPALSEVTFPATFDLAVNPQGGKLYWSEDERIMWANLDGSGAATLFTLPAGADPRADRISNIVVDSANGRIYFGAIDLETNGGDSLAATSNSQIWAMNADGSNPTVLVNFGSLQNVAVIGLALSQDKTRLYWTQRQRFSDRTSTGNGLFSVATSGGTPAPATANPAGVSFISILEVSPNLPATPASHPSYAYWSVGSLIEQVDLASGAAGYFAAEPPLHLIGASATARIAGLSTNASDIALSKLPGSDLVASGGMLTYQLQVRNNGPLAAGGVSVVSTLPANTTFVAGGSSSQCAPSGGDKVTCNLDQLADSAERTVAIQVQVGAAAGASLTHNVTVSSNQPDPQPANNSVSFAETLVAPQPTAAPATTRYLYWGYQGTLYRTRTDGSASEKVVGYPTLANEIIQGVVVDGVNGHVYVASRPDALVGNGYIRRLNLDGTGLATVYTDASAPWPTTLALDSANNRLYFTHGGELNGDAIKRIDLNGSNETTVVNNLVGLTGLALNPLRNELYWSDGAGRLMRAALDGSNPQPIAADLYAYDLTVDPYADQIYYRIRSPLAIYRILRSGGEAEPVVTNGTGAHGPALDSANGKLYWIDGAVFANLRQANLNGSNPVITGAAGARPTSQLALAFTDAPLAPSPAPTATNTPIPASTATPLPTPTSGGPAAATNLFWSNQGGQIVRAPVSGCLDGSCIQLVVTPSPGTSAGDIAIDSVRGKLYWINPVDKSIQRSDLTGANPQTLISGLTDPRSITLDENGARLYWTDFSTGVIRSAGLDGSAPLTVTTGLTNLLWIDFAPSQGALYFVQSNQVSDNHDDRLIRRINPNGSNLVNILIGYPDGPLPNINFEITGLTVNEKIGRIYWMDQDSLDAGSYRLNWIALNGTGANNGLVFSTIPSLRGLTHDRNAFSLYWAAGNEGQYSFGPPFAIQRSFAEGKLSGQPVITTTTGLGNQSAAPFDLALYYQSAAPATCQADSSEPNDAVANATTVQLGTPLTNRNFHTGSDVDWFVINLSGGLRYRISAQAAGSDADTLLDLYASNGTTVLASNDNVAAGQTDSQILLDAPLSGKYYARVRNRVKAAALPCNNRYTFSVQQSQADQAQSNSTNRLTNLVPANYTPPLFDSAIVTPTDGTLLGSLAATNVHGAATAVDGIASLAVTVNGANFYNVAPGGSITKTTWSQAWTPPGEGSYLFNSVVTDSSNRVQTRTRPINVIVDLAPPQVTLARTVYTQTHLISANQLNFSGSVTDSNGVARVEVRVANGPWQGATVTGTTWNYPWLLGGNVDGGNVTVAVRATDRAGRIALTTANVTIDVDGPGLPPVAAQPATAVAVAQVVQQANTSLTLSWQAATDGSGVLGYYAGFTTSSTPSLAVLTFYNGAGTHTQNIAEAQIVYGHVVAMDDLGNQTVRTVGPFQVDGPATPDLISDLANNGWLSTGGSHLSTDWEVTHGIYANASYGAPQKFFTSWDNQALRLAWSGANWDGDGDLFIYLDTGADGATTLYNPYPTPAEITLPAGMNAKYVVWVRNATTAQLLQFNGSGWTVVTTLGANNFRHSAALTDLYLPFSLLGLSNASSLGIVAVASEEGALRLWAASPDKNPLNSARVTNPAVVGRDLSTYALTLTHHWANLALGQIPNAGLAPESDLVLTIASDAEHIGAGYLDSDLLDLLQPNQTLDANSDGIADVALPGNQNVTSLGNGQSIKYTVQYANRGSTTAQNVVLTLTGLGGLTVDPTVNLGDIAAGAVGTVDFTATINGAVNGVELQAKVSDGAHGVYDWFWFVHPVDTQAPTDLTIVAPNTAVRSGNQIVLGEAQDASPLAKVVVNVNGTLTTCDTGAGDGHLWSCPVNFGDLSGVSSLNLQAQTTDIHGNTSGFVGIALAVDNAPPTVALDSITEAALADGFISAAEARLAGVVSDDRQATGLEFCEVAENGLVGCDIIATNPEASATGNWSRFVSVDDSDGVTQTLRLTGIDHVDNRSEPLTRTFRLDGVVPVVTATLSAAGISGLVSDGGGVGAVRLRVESPSGAAYWVNAERNGEQWSLLFTNTEAGEYTLYVEAVDLAGNVGAVGPFTLVYGGGQNSLFLPLVIREGGPSPSGQIQIYLPLISK